MQIFKNISNTPAGGEINHSVNATFDEDGNLNTSGVHHYEIDQTSGDTKVTIEVTDIITYPNAKIVTNYEYEQRRQDRIRQIRILDPRYKDTFIDEYIKLMNETAI